MDKADYSFYSWNKYTVLRAQYVWPIWELFCKIHSSEMRLPLVCCVLQFILSVQIEYSCLWKEAFVFYRTSQNLKKAILL